MGPSGANVTGYMAQPGFVSSLRRGVDILNSICAILSVACFVGIAIVSCYTVLARKFGVGTPWSLDIQLLLLVWGTFISLGHVQSSRGHIEVDLFGIDARPRLQRLRRIAFEGIGLLFVGMIIWYAAKEVWASHTAGYKTNTLLALPLWTLTAALPVGCSLLALVVIAEIIAEPSRRTGETVEHPAEI